jgi:hypothetical protein
LLGEPDFLLRAKLSAAVRVGTAVKGQEVHVREGKSMRCKGLGALVLSVIVVGLVPGVALAAKAAATTGGASAVTFSSVRLNGSVDPNSTATTYYFQYGTTIALGTQTVAGSAGKGKKAVHVATDVGGLAPATRYFYRVVAHNRSGTTLGKRRSFKTHRQPLGVSLSASPNPVAPGQGTTLAGTLTGTGNAGRKIVLQSNPWPYTQGFRNASNEQLTNAQGGFAFPLLAVLFNTQYRVQMPERPAVVSPIGTVGVLFIAHTHVNKHRVKRGRRVHFSGSIFPARSGAQVALQKKKSGRWVTVGGTVTRSGGKFSKRLKIRRGGSYRVWAGVPDGQYTSNNGRTVYLRSHR